MVLWRRVRRSGPALSMMDRQGRPFLNTKGTKGRNLRKVRLQARVEVFFRVFSPGATCDSCTHMDPPVTHTSLVKS